MFSVFVSFMAFSAPRMSILILSKPSSSFLSFSSVSRSCFSCSVLRFLPSSETLRTIPAFESVSVCCIFSVTILLMLSMPSRFSLRSSVISAYSFSRFSASDVFIPLCSLPSLSPSSPTWRSIIPETESFCRASWSNTARFPDSTLSFIFSASPPFFAPIRTSITISSTMMTAQHASTAISIISSELF